MKSKNILIVEDKEQERKLFEYLVGQIHAFQSFDSCKEALVHLANQKPNLILISIQLTDLEPLSFLQKVSLGGSFLPGCSTFFKYRSGSSSIL
jgi:DNA-binding NtrC family response regulator